LLQNIPNTDRFSKLIHLTLSVYGLFLLYKAAKIFIFHTLNGAGGWDGPASYMPIAERVADGAHLYSDIFLKYTPLGIYILSWFQNILQPWIDDKITIHYIAIIFTHLLTMAFLIRIFIILSINWSLILVCLGIYSHFIIAYVGSHVFLEQFAVIFIAFTILIILENKFGRYQKAILLGIGASFAYMSKQYGLVLFPVISTLLMCDMNEEKFKSKNILWFVFLTIVSIFMLLNTFIRPLLYIIPCITALLILVEFSRDSIKNKGIELGLMTGSFLISFLLIILFMNTTLLEFFHQTYQSGYEQWGKVSSGKFLGFVYYSFYYSIIIFIAFIFIKRHRIPFRICFLFIFAFTPCLAIRQFDHYFLMQIPIFIIMIAMSLHSFLKFNKLLTCITCLLIAFNHNKLVTSRWHDNLQDTRIRLHQKGRDINEIFKPGEHVLILASPQLYYFSNLYSSSEKNFGYGYETILNYKDFSIALKEADKVIFDRVRYKYTLKFIKSDQNLTKVMNDIKSDFRLIRKDSNNLEYWVRN
jgi:hypothetical protein